MDTLPVFPVEMERMTRVRERISIARRLDKLLLDNRCLNIIIMSHVTYTIDCIMQSILCYFIIIILKSSPVSS